MQTLGKYQLGAPLGQGGMGAVYRSFHPQLNRPVAVKVMLANVAADPQAHQRFLREAQLVATLSHPNIVNIFDVDIQDNQPYIVMDFADGGSLAAQLQAGPLSLDQALDLAIPLADALEYAHRQGVIHRDLKPANVLLRADGSPVLADFGLARPLQVLSDAQITATGALLGTLAYMAPEQFSGRAADTRADIYAFGVMLFEMLTGRIPFDGDSAQILYGHLQQPPPAPRQLNPALPAAVEQLILQMLAKDPADRPQSMAEVAAALRSLRDSGAATGRTIALAPAPTLVAAHPASSPPPTVSVPGPADINSSHRVLKGLLIGAVVAALWIGSLWLPLKSQTTAPPQAQPTALAVERPTRRPTQVESDPPPTSQGTPLPAALKLVSEPLLSGPKQVGPEAFSVGGISYRQDNDSVWFFGEVRNDGSEARESVQVRVILRDAAGAELLSKSATTERSYLKPGEISPFSVLFSKDDAPPQFASYDVEVRSKKADFQLGYTYRDLSIVGEPRARRDSLGFFAISGRVRNDGKQPAKFVQIFVVFYDGEGRVVGVSNGFAETANDAPLAPGADARFELQAIVFSAPPTDYRLFVEGSSAT